MFEYRRSPDEKGQTLTMLKPGTLKGKLALKAKILLEKEKNKETTKKPITTKGFRNS